MNEIKEELLRIYLLVRDEKKATSIDNVFFLEFCGEGTVALSVAIGNDTRAYVYASQKDDEDNWPADEEVVEELYQILMKYTNGQLRLAQ